jgi:hypothetical protein
MLLQIAKLGPRVGIPTAFLLAAILALPVDATAQCQSGVGLNCRSAPVYVPPPPRRPTPPQRFQQEQFKPAPVYIPPPPAAPIQRSQPTYQPTQPNQPYQPTQPTYQPIQPAYQPTQPAYQPTQPAYQSTQPAAACGPAEPTVAGAIPAEIPTEFSLRDPGGSLSRGAANRDCLSVL